MPMAVSTVSFCQNAFLLDSFLFSVCVNDTDDRQQEVSRVTSLASHSFCRQLIFKVRLYCKHYGPRSDCSHGSELGS